MADHIIRVAIIGATGYGGAEAFRLLQGHPRARVVAATSARNPGKPLADSCPWLETDLLLSEFEPSLDADVFFLCQEVGFAADHAAELEKHARVIDFSADFRLQNAEAFRTTYRAEWPNERLAQPPAYGLPELGDRAAIATAKVVANPGCYPTAALLSLMPLVRAGLLDGVPVIDAKSGVSGAGRSKSDTFYTFSELSGGFSEYGAVHHRHVPEIEQMAGVNIRFTPHLLPVARGIESTLHAPLKKGCDSETLMQAYRSAYDGEPFVKLVNQPPSIKAVVGSNRALIHVLFDERTGFAVVSTVIDNLVKGMAGQAIQNMNLMFNFPEETGLPVSGLWP